MPLPFIPYNYDLVRMLEEKVGLQSDFLIKLYEEDDWSFIIKLHALLEAACSHLIVAHLQKPELADFFGRLELSGKTVGKIVILKKLDLLSEYHRRFILSLSELRNILAHDIRYSNFTLAKYFEALDSKSKVNFAKSFGPDQVLNREVAELERSIQQMKVEKGHSIEQTRIRDYLSDQELVKSAQSDPKLHIWTGAFSTLCDIVERDWYSDYQQWLDEKRSFKVQNDEM
jgi:hypothetical protein